jgi:hypothetical protein
MKPTSSMEVDPARSAPLAPKSIQTTLNKLPIFLQFIYVLLTICFSDFHTANSEVVSPKVL